jgi:outer membrane protease
MLGVESRWESGRALGLDLNLRTAIPGMSVGEMNDYDWLYTDRDWSHWSVSDIDQKFGFTLDAVADWQIAKKEGFRLRLGVGYHLDWWGWTDTTKDSVYSLIYGPGGAYPMPYDGVDGAQDEYGDVWRGDPGSVPAGVNGINYNTAYHVPLVSLTAALEQKVFFLRADGRIGPVLAFGKDHHLLRDLYFYDSAFGGPWIDTSLETGFRTAGGFSFTLRGEYAWLNETRGNTKIVPTDGSPSGVAEDSAGFSFRRVGVSVLGSWSLGS